jgi:hypothetical protein
MRRGDELSAAGGLETRFGESFRPTLNTADEGVSWVAAAWEISLPETGSRTAQRSPARALRLIPRQINFRPRESRVLKIYCKNKKTPSGS